MMTSSLSSSSITNQSIFSDKSSNRSEPNDSVFDKICRYIGISPEDFAKRASVWEDRRVSEISESVQSSRRSFTETSVVDKLSDGFTARVLNWGDDESEKCSDPPDDVYGSRESISASESIVDNLDRSLSHPSCYGSPAGSLANSRVFEGIGEVRIAIEDEKLIDGASVVLQSFLDSLSYCDGDDDYSCIWKTELEVLGYGSFDCSIKNLQKGDILGIGAYGAVYEGYTNNGLFLTIKEVPLLATGNIDREFVAQLKEISLLSQLQHENIVRCLGAEMVESKLYVFFELVPKGSLAHIYRKYQLCDTQVSAYTKQILRGLHYLHSCNMVHRDICCSNILVDANGCVKLAGFASAKFVNKKNDGYEFAADIWSLGCTVLEMLTGQTPYSNSEAMQEMLENGEDVDPPIPDNLSNDARDFIRKCLQVNPIDRPTTAQLLNHPFVRESALTFPLQR